MPEDLATGRQTQSTLTSTRIDSRHAVPKTLRRTTAMRCCVAGGRAGSEEKRGAVVGDEPAMLARSRCDAEANELAFHLQGRRRNVD